ncbi:SMP-30/gluconolactonase/LRE family protein [Actomonas aquatica]|uniref:SMP-30/gluconolactonase/LRE family protein n=1 Tax=Actomonas aquatica TaxID=2866162 RepID=A0ABZ1CCI5_9BACT|nr:SMP-30/gluconolactonase/LRE family protein [Opitutus sp. WL0086]WRQ89208.1 SMP-30/gluconolactonase/LRE family protein [Opitutus sp. WL0086]
MTGALRADRPAAPVHASPQALCLSPDGALVAVVNATSDSVSFIDATTHAVLRQVPVGQRPNHARFSADGRQLYVSCAWDGTIDVVDVAAGKVSARWDAGGTPNGVALSPDGATLYVVDASEDRVRAIDVGCGRIQWETPVRNQPRYVTTTPDGARVLVSNNLGRTLTIVEAATGRVAEQRDLGRCSMLREVVTSSDGRWAFVANLVSHDEMPTLQIERGWIHSNGFTIMDLEQPGHRVTLLLDHLLQGAANPTGLVLSADNRWLYVSLAGIHEIAIVDVAKALELAATAQTADDVRRLQENVEIVEQLGIARRVSSGGLGPRSVALDEARGELWVAHYFSDAVAVLDANCGTVKESIPLHDPVEMSLWRQGELLSCDARMCYQNWFSCVSCHQEDGTVDGLNWDLANDGLGNPKSAKDLINGHDTAPAMWGAVRASLFDGIAGGQRFEGFVADQDRQDALETYFGSPEHVPNPYQRRQSPELIERGRLIFLAAGCDICHPAPRFTDQKLHDLGFKTVDDFRARFDTPSLRNVYRNGPWLHDGRAMTLEAIFTDHNPDDVHGRTRGLSSAELAALVAYLRTL